MCIALAAHEIDAVETIYLNDVPVTLDGSGYVQEEPYKMAKLENAQETFSGSSIVLAHVPEAASVTVTRPGEASTEPGGQYNTIRVEHTLVGSTVTIGEWRWAASSATNTTPRSARSGSAATWAPAPRRPMPR
jgi:hypothetical protein